LEKVETGRRTAGAAPRGQEGQGTLREE
jgi:hypothetical protein